MFNNVLANAMLSSNAIVNVVGKALYKNADKILLGAGIGLICGGTVSAIATTTKIKDVVEDHKRCMAEAIDGPAEGIGKRKLVVYKDTAIDLLKAYGPCVLLTGIGIGFIMGSHYILTSRYTALTVAYAAMDQSFKDYRSRVKEAIGAEKEYKLFNDASEIEVGEIDEKGKLKSHKETLYNGSKDPYTFLFGNTGNENWQKDDPDANIMFLEQRQDWLNRKLDHKRIITLAEVIEDLGLVNDRLEIPSYAFDMVWCKDNPNGDGYIDFGHRACMDFMSKREKEVWLNFNCDGLLRKIRKEKQPVLATANA